MERIVHRHANTLLALTHAEGAAKLDAILQLVLCDQSLKLLYDQTRTLDVAGATNANCDFEHDDFLSFYYFSASASYEESASG